MAGRISVEEGIERALACKAMLYNRKGKKHGGSELRFLYKLASLAPPGIAVECGVYHGGSLVCWTGARDGPFVAVDNWMFKNEHRFRANMERYDLDVTVLSMNSWKAPACIDGKVAFCFIDALHDGKGIPNDIAVWPDKIMDGGIIAFHDYDTWKCKAVKQAVDKWQARAQWEFMGLIGSTIAFRRSAAETNYLPIYL